MASADPFATLAAGLLALTGWIGVGRVLVRRVAVETTIGTPLLALALGVVVHSTAQAIGLLAGVPSVVPFLLVAVAGGWILVRERSAVVAEGRAAITRLRAVGGVEKIGIGLVAAVLALQTLAAFAPPTSYDALCYHLPEIEKYARTASLEPIAHVTQTYYPKGIDVLFVGAYAVGGATAAQLIHSLLGVAFVLAVIAITRRLIGIRTAIGTGLLVLAYRDVAYELGTANVDLGFAFFQVAAIGTLPAVFGAGGRRAAALVGMLAGFGVAAKLLGAGLVAILTASVAIGEITRRRWRAGLTRALVLGAFALLAYLPWFARAHLELGTFAYPLRPAKVEVAGRPEAPAASMTSELAMAGRRYPLRESPAVSAPWILTFAPAKHKEPLSPIVPALLPVAVFLLAVRWRTHGALVAMTAVALLSGVFWFKTYPVTRYVLGPLGVLTIAFAMAVRWLAREGYVARVVVVGLVGLVAGLALAKGARDALFAARAVVSPGFRERYVELRVNSAQAMRRVLEETGPEPRILSSDPRVFLLGPNAEHAGRWNAAWPPADADADLAAWLRIRRIEWVAFFATKSGEIDRDRLRALRAEGTLAAVFDDDGAALYRVQPE